MAYTIYRNVRVISIRPKEVQPMRRPQDIVDSTRRREAVLLAVNKPFIQSKRALVELKG